MRLGVLADTHGNVAALEAVLAHAKRQNVTEFVDLGDVLYGPLWPRETMDLVMRTNFLAIVRGNQDRVLHSSTRETIAANPTLSWVLGQLTERDLATVRSWPFQTTLHSQFHAFHGTPASDTEYLLEDISTSLPVMRKEAEIAAALSTISEPVALCGHTHVARLVRLSSSGQLVLNPGSVGLAAYDDQTPALHYMESFSPHASYAVVENAAGGKWDVSFHRVAYDWTAAANRAKMLGRMDWARGIEAGRMA